MALSSYIAERRLTASAHARDLAADQIADTLGHATGLLCELKRRAPCLRKGPA